MRTGIAIGLVCCLGACQPIDPPVAADGAGRLAEHRMRIVTGLCQNGSIPRNQGTHATQAMIDDGWRQVQGGRFALALDRFTGSVILGKERPDAYWGMAVAAHGAGYSDALVQSCFEKAEAGLSPVPAGLHADWGRVLETRDQPDAAIDRFKQALAIDPGMVEAHKGMARAYLKLGNEAAAAPHVEAIRRLSEGG